MVASYHHAWIKSSNPLMLCCRGFEVSGEMGLPMFYGTIRGRLPTDDKAQSPKQLKIQ